VNTSSAAIHLWAAGADRPNYGATKSAGTLALQQIAKDVSVDDMQIVSFHPGAIFTEGAKNAGYREDAIEWNSGEFYFPRHASL
jgi:NAD(P)-dependent dehydrogenase (short-subunit alcohol dehydrogenase family)